MQNGISNPYLAKPMGVQLSFRESLEEQEIRLQGKGVFHMNTKIKVKISGDGTNIGKRD